MADKVGVIHLPDPADSRRRLGARARARRLDLDLSQEGLARRAATSVRTIRRFEADGSIALDTLLRVASVLAELEVFDTLFAARPPSSLDDLCGCRQRERSSRAGRLPGSAYGHLQGAKTHRARNRGSSAPGSVPGAFWLPSPLAGLTTTDARLTACLPPEPEPPPTPKRVPGERGVRWARMMAEGVYASRAELARAEGVSRAAVTQGLGRRN